MATAARAAPNTSRITVNLPTKVWDALRELAAREGISYTEALRRAISTEVFVDSVIAEGSELAVRRKNGDFERVIFQY